MKIDMRNTVRRILFIIVCSIVSTFSVSFATAHELIEIQDHVLSIHYGIDNIVLQACDESIVKISYIADGTQSPSTLMILERDWPYTPVTIDTTGDPILFSTSKLSVEFGIAEFFIKIMDDKGRIVFYQQLLTDITNDRLHCLHGGGNIYGIENNQNGDLTRSGEIDIEAGSQGDAGAPFLWSSNGWGMICDLDGGKIDIQGDELSFIKHHDDNRTGFEIYVFTGEPTHIFEAATDITGKPPLFPRYSLGFINTEWGLDEAELLDDIATYRVKNIPIDVYVLDFDWMAYGEDDYGEFRWGPKFPGAINGTLQPKLDSLGIKLFGIRKPRVHLNTMQGNHYSENSYFFDESTDYFTGKRVGRLNFLDDRVRDWYWSSFGIRERSYDKGIVGYWNDEADEYGGNFMFMNMQRSNYEGQREYNNIRVWSINRNFYLGAQRYAYAHWSGDIPTGFNSMARQRVFMLSSVNLASGWWSMDTGGFHGTPSQQNYIRWIQFATFVPLMRVHGSLDQEREPWYFGELAEQIAREYINLRYSFIPYIYSYARENHETGVSIVRPFHFMYPENNSLANMTDQWFFGNEMFVRPVTEESVSSVTVFIPDGTWYEFWTGSKFIGPQYVNLSVSMENIPLFVRAGAIIPMQFPGSIVDDAAVSGPVLRIVNYPGDEGHFTLYEDDGLTYAYEDDVYCNTSFRSRHDDDLSELIIEQRLGVFTPAERDYLAEFMLMPDEPDSVLLDGRRVMRNDDVAVIDSTVHGWTHDDTKQKTLVRLDDDGASHTINVFYQADRVPPTVDSVRCIDRNTVHVYFSERVKLGDELHSAEWEGNYAINKGVSVVNAVAMSNGNTIVLLTSPHQEGEDYTITIKDIADQSRLQNIMSAATLYYTCEKNPFRIETIQQGLNGYHGTSDAHIAEHFPDNNMGGYHLFEVCRYGGNSEDDEKSMLIKFDLNDLFLQTESLMKAELVLLLYETRNGYPSKSVACHRLVRTWAEGNTDVSIDGDLALTGSVTWNSALHNALPWRQPGGDFKQMPDDEIVVHSDTGNEYRWDITSSLLFWLAEPDSNYGVILREINPSTFSGTKVFASSENEDVSIRPRIELTYSVPVLSDPMNSDLPENFTLYQNYPNPFNSTCIISFDLPVTNRVTMEIYNVYGQRVKSILDARLLMAGHHKFSWNGTDGSGLTVSSGVYLCNLVSSSYNGSKKMVFLR
ncbi:DNRLRE domain-containing protein [candidate division KSB1 bacterium]|nr:DNRLRE domain-containing protein [candidate division KSB1 bacterium]